jgi:hypothetical protein
MFALLSCPKHVNIDCFDLKQTFCLQDYLKVYDDSCSVVIEPRLIPVADDM